LSFFIIYRLTKGNSPIILALFIARANIRWCLAQVPV